MFLTLTFTHNTTEHGRVFATRTINAAEISSITAVYWIRESAREHGSKITWIDRDRPHSMVTASPNDIAVALGAKDLTTR